GALDRDGERVLAVGRRMLALNDQLLEDLHDDVAGVTIRLGLPQDVAERWLPTALARFTRLHPRAQLSVRVERNNHLKELLSAGAIDLAVTFDPEPGRPDPEEVQLPVRWLAARGFRWNSEDPLPLVLFEPPCTFRRLGLEALDRGRVPWRVAFTSPSLSGLWAAVSAGIGVTVRTQLGAPPAGVPVGGRPPPAPPPPAVPRRGRAGPA